MTLLERFAGTGDVMEVGDQLHPHRWRVGLQLLALGGTDQHGDVALLHHRQFAGAGTLGSAQQSRIAGHFGTTTFAQVVQVHRVEHGARLRRIALQQRQALVGNMVADQQRYVEASTMRAQPAGDAIEERCIPDFHTHPLQRVGGGAAVFATGGNEHHMGPALQQEADQVHRRSDAESRSGCGTASSRSAPAPATQQQRR